MSQGNINIENKRIIVVLGSGRSGTSVITRGLQVFGVDLGDNLMPPEQGVNDKGFWEDQDIYALNLEIFRIVNHGWNKLTPVPLSELSEKTACNLKSRASELLQKKLSSVSCFGMKDPQLTRLLPFWKDVFMNLHVNVSYVIACRNPVSVARSLTKYTGCELERSYLLWFEHTITSLQDTINQSRIVVDYDLLMSEPVNQLKRLSKALELDFDSHSDEVMEFQSQFLENKLRHNNYDKNDLESDRSVPPSVKSLFELLFSFANDTAQHDDPKSISLVNRINRHHQDNKLLLQYVQEKIDVVSVLSAGHDKHIAQLNDTLESVIADRDAKAAGLEQVQSAYETQCSDRDKHIAQLSDTLESVIADRDAKQANSDMQKNELTETKNKLVAISESRSWRYTAPFRRFTKILHAIAIFSRLTKWSTTTFQTIIKQESNSSTNRRDIPKDKKSSEHFSTESILLVSYYCPTRAHAGGLRILDLYALIQKHCPNIQLDLFTHHRSDIDWEIGDVYEIFHNVYLSPSEDLTPNNLEVLVGKRSIYDIVDLQFHQCGYLIDDYRRIGGKVIYTPMESLSKALYQDLRSKLIDKNLSSICKATVSLSHAAEEITFVPKVDEVVCVSKSDAAFLRAVTSLHHICGLDTGISQIEFADALSPEFTISPASVRQCRILYIAYFGSETNLNALRWYLNNVHSRLKANVPDYILTVVGRGDLSTFTNYKSDSSIEFVGEVPAIAPHIEKARVAIAPAFSGSGFRGKVNQYAVMGVPTVVSPIAFKGLLYKDEVDIFVAETPEEFAGRCTQLLLDTDLNDRMGRAARKLCMERYTWQSKWNVIRRIYNLNNFV